MKNNEERVKSIMKKAENYKKQRGEVLTATTLGLCAVLGLFFYTNVNDNNILNLNINEYAGIEVSGDIKDKEYASIEEINLPTFSSKEEILEKVKTNENHYLISDTLIFESADMSTAINSSNIKDFNTDSATSGFGDSAKESIEKDYSSTNVQVNGVDEGDIVKTNGDYIYYIKNENLYIFETKTTKTKLVKTIKIGVEHNSYAQEIYIDDNYITVIAEEYMDRNEILKIEEIGNLKNSTTVTAMYVFDINSYELVKSVKTEGNYISSRKIENNIYMITNRYLYSYKITEKNILPIYTETMDDNETCVEILPQDIKYFPNIEKNTECNYMLITSINLSDLNNKATIDTYLGAGTEIYCSNENLYVTRVERPSVYYGGFVEILSDDTIEIDTALNTPLITIVDENSTMPSTPKVVTKIHKFKLLDGAVKYVATGEVEGALLNQYSMDENNGYFRITTTSNSGNSLYVLNEKLEVVGELENLAKGEKIYATRFMGDKCYIVTYKTVDPLFVIDLSNPENPVVLGELKIPGYSTYLHPLGENYLIGFGEDSVEKNYIDWQGESQVTAYNVGLKLAIFDVSDLNNPKELHSVRIGGRGSTSSLLDNPKALYYDAEEGIFAFPAIVYEETKFYKDGTPMYGDIEFSGALVYNLSVEEGIELRGKIEHEGARNYYKNIERIISIGENFYTISPEMIKVTNIETMQEIQEGTCKFGSKNDRY